VDGKNISFHVGTATYTGTFNGEQIELRRAAPLFPGVAATPPAETGPRPAIGPPPDGSDPSLAGFRNRGGQMPIVLRRANR
jgi:beta-galactosidase